MISRRDKVMLLHLPGFIVYRITDLNCTFPPLVSDPLRVVIHHSGHAVSVLPMEIDHPRVACFRSASFQSYETRDARHQQARNPLERTSIVVLR